MWAGFHKIRHPQVTEWEGLGSGRPMYRVLQVLVGASREKHLDHRRVAFGSSPHQGRVSGLLEESR